MTPLHCCLDSTAAGLGMTIGRSSVMVILSYSLWASLQAKTVHHSTRINCRECQSRSECTRDLHVLNIRSSCSVNHLHCSYCKGGCKLGPGCKLRPECKLGPGYMQYPASSQHLGSVCGMLPQRTLLRPVRTLLHQEAGSTTHRNNTKQQACQHHVQQAEQVQAPL